MTMRVGGSKTVQGQAGAGRPDAPTLPDPIAVALEYLRLVEARDLTAAKSNLADRVVMVFPGADPMHSLEEVMDWAAPRYRAVVKAYDAEESLSDGETQIVYLRGTLSGSWPDGTPFAGIRFIDRFELRDGKIMRQDVWNDLAEWRPQ